MKTILITSFMLLLFCACGSKSSFTYRLTKNNILYHGVENPFFIESNGKPVEVSIQNGTITQTEFNRELYSIVPTPDKGIVTITITQGKKKKEVQYYAYNLPAPELLFRGRMYEDRTIPVSGFANDIIALFPVFTYTIEIELQSFKIIRITPDGKAIHYTTTGKKLPPKLIAEVSAGDKIVFYDLIFKTAGTGYVFKGQDCVYTIK